MGKWIIIIFIIIITIFNIIMKFQRFYKIWPRSKEIQLLIKNLN